MRLKKTTYTTDEPLTLFEISIEVWKRSALITLVFWFALTVVIELVRSTVDVLAIFKPTIISIPEPGNAVIFAICIAIFFILTRVNSPEKYTFTTFQCFKYASIFAGTLAALSIVACLLLKYPVKMLLALLAISIISLITSFALIFAINYVIKKTWYKVTGQILEEQSNEINS